MNKQRIVRFAALIVVAAIYVAVRFRNLTSSCLWFDEIFSVHAAEHSWNSILNFVALDLIHPPLFYVVLKMWIAIGGESLVWLRTLPVFFSALAIVPLLLLARELRVNYWSVVLALFLISVNGSLIKYAQEVRMYSMLMCIALFSMWLFARYFQKGKGLASLTLINVVLVNTHYFGWLVVLSEVVAIFAFQRIKWRAIVGMTGLLAVAFVPWLVAVLYAAGSGSQVSQNIGWMQRPGLLSLVQLILNFLEPFYYPATSVDPFSIYRISIPIFVIASVAIYLYFARTKVNDRSKNKGAIFLSTFCIIPLVAAFAASWMLPYSVWGTRHLIIVFAPFLLLVAGSVTQLSDRRLRIASLTLLILFAGYAFVVDASRPKVPPIWCGFEVIAEKLRADEAGPVYVFEDLAAYHLWFEFRNVPDLNSRQRVIKVDDFPGMAEDKSYFVPRGLDDGYLVHGQPDLKSPHSQMWLVYRATDLDTGKPPLDIFTANGFQITRHYVYDGDTGKIIAVFVRKS